MFGCEAWSASLLAGTVAGLQGGRKTARSRVTARVATLDAPKIIEREAREPPCGSKGTAVHAARGLSLHMYVVLYNVIVCHSYV